MAQYDAAAVRQRLLAEKQRVEQEIYRQTQGDEVVPATDPLLDGVSDAADDADALADNERTQMLVEDAQDTLQQINSALARLDAGTYGVCAVCGKEIDARRLEALPYATLCIDDQAAAEAAGRQP